MGVEVMVPSEEDTIMLLKMAYGSAYMTPTIDAYKCVHGNKRYVCALNLMMSVFYLFGTEVTFIHRIMKSIGKALVVVVACVVATTLVYAAIH